MLSYKMDFSSCDIMPSLVNPVTYDLCVSDPSLTTGLTFFAFLDKFVFILVETPITAVQLHRVIRMILITELPYCSI